MHHHNTIPTTHEAELLTLLQISCFKVATASIGEWGWTEFHTPQQEWPLNKTYGDSHKTPSCFLKQPLVCRSNQSHITEWQKTQNKAHIKEIKQQKIKKIKNYRKLSNPNIHWVTGSLLHAMHGVIWTSQALEQCAQSGWVTLSTHVLLQGYF